MREILLLIAAVWGASGTITIAIFTLDERAHRRTVRASAQPVSRISMPVASRASRRYAHDDRALA